MASQVGWDRVIRAADRLEPGLRRRVLAALEEMRGQVSTDEIVRALEGSPGRVAELLAAASASAVSVSVLEGLARDLSRLAAGIAFDELRPAAGVAGPFEIDFARVDYAASEWAGQYAAREVTFITEETRDAIRAIVARAPVEGITVQQQAALIRDIVGLNERQGMAVVNRYAGMVGQWRRGELTWAQVERRTERYVREQLRYRAQMIARTESLAAARASLVAGWREAEAAGLIDPQSAWQEWSAAADACDECAERADSGERWPYDEEWEAPHPNCRCSSVLVQGELGKSAVLKPLGRFPDFAACVTAMSRKLGSVEAARRYCGRLQHLIEGSVSDG